MVSNEPSGSIGHIYIYIDFREGRRDYDIFKQLSLIVPVTVAELSKACIVFARSEAGIVGSNPTQGMDVWCVCVCVCVCVCACIFLCLCTGKGLATS
jgi:hypothetical protein